MADFSSQLRSFMSRSNITQVILAKAVGVSQGAVSGWLNGVVPKMETLLKIAEVLQVPPDDLLFPERRRAPMIDAVAIANKVGGSDEQRTAIVNAAAQVLADRVIRESAASYVTGARARLKDARIAKGLTPYQLAKKMGYSNSSMYLDIEEGRSQMGEKMARRAAEILGIDVSELMDGSDHPIERNPSGGTFGAIPDIRLPPGMTAKYVPLLSLAQCGPEMTWTDEGYTGEGVVAFNCRDPKAFAVRLAGDSMQPKYDAGDTAIIYPSHEPKNGDVVLARLDDSHGGDVMIKLYSHSNGTVTLTSYNAAVYGPIVWPRSAFALIYPVAQITKNLR